MKILVTGGAGFIGSNVVDTYIRDGHTVAILDDFSSGKSANVAKDVKVYEGSIEDAAFVKAAMQDFQPDVVNHHAAQISVVVSTDEPVIDALRNIIGTLNVIQAVKNMPSVQRFIYASSGGAMYGNPVELPCQETTVSMPLSPYGLSKHTAERYVWLMLGDSPCKTVVLRYSNVYGPRQDPHGEAGVCAIFTGRMLANQPVTIYGDGSQVRDYVFVEDVAQANLAALSRGEGESFNIATGEGTSTLQVYQVLKDATSYSQSPIMGPARDGEVQKVVLSPEKASVGLGWKAQNNFSQGIKKTVAWYRNSLV